METISSARSILSVRTTCVPPSSRSTRSATINVRSTARHAIHLQFDIGSNILEIRALQSTNIVSEGKQNGGNGLCSVWSLFRFSVKWASLDIF
jgi:hypothetical protein